MAASDRLEQLLSPTVAGLGYELLGIERQPLGQGSLLRLYIDSPSGITLDDCERVSRQVSDVLEADQALPGSYTLEISSPGLDRPLFSLDHYRQHVGAEVQLKLRTILNGRRKFVGTLVGVGVDTVAVRVADEQHDIPYAMIDRARLVPAWPVTKRAGR